MSVKELKRSFADLVLDGLNPTLVLGWNEPKGQLGGGTYPLRDDAAEYLKSIAADSLALIDECETFNYDGATLIVPGEQAIWVPIERMRHDSPMLELLIKPDKLETLRAADVEKRSLSFSAIGFGTKKADRTFFVRRKAQNFQGSTRTYFRLTADLRPIKESIISIDHGVDFILRPEGALVFETMAFEKFIQEPADAQAAHELNVAAFKAKLPCTPATERLLRRLSKKITIRARLRSLCESAHFKDLSIEKVRTKLTELRLPLNEYVNGANLDFAEKHAAVLLRFLDNGVWRGPFNDALYSTDGKKKEQ